MQWPSRKAVATFQIHTEKKYKYIGKKRLVCIWWYVVAMDIFFGLTPKLNCQSQKFVFIFILAGLCLCVLRFFYAIYANQIVILVYCYFKMKREKRKKRKKNLEKWNIVDERIMFYRACLMKIQFIIKFQRIDREKKRYLFHKIFSVEWRRLNCLVEFLWSNFTDRERNNINTIIN